MGHGSTAGRAVLDGIARPAQDDTLAFLESAALEFVNELRITDNRATLDALVQGYAQDCGNCTLAVSVNADMLPSREGYWEIGPFALRFGPRGGLRSQVEVPTDVREFMAAFDAGMLPHLEASSCN